MCIQITKELKHIFEVKHYSLDKKMNFDEIEDVMKALGYIT